jgi:hypothetical protein
LEVDLVGKETLRMKLLRPTLNHRPAKKREKFESDTLKLLPFTS